MKEGRSPPAHLEHRIKSAQEALSKAHNHSMSMEHEHKAAAAGVEGMYNKSTMEADHFASCQVLSDSIAFYEQLLRIVDTFVTSHRSFRSPASLATKIRSLG